MAYIVPRVVITNEFTALYDGLMEQYLATTNPCLEIPLTTMPMSQVRMGSGWRKPTKKNKLSKAEYNMGWATSHINTLMGPNAPLSIIIRPRGKSMEPRIKDGATVTIVPAKKEELQIDDVVLCKVKGLQYLHKITAIDSKRGFQISNNKGKINGWTHSIYGKVTRIVN